MLKDPRLKKLAETLVLYSVDMQPGENVMIATTIKAKPLVLELCRVIREHGGNPIVELTDDGTPRDDFVLIPVELMPGFEPVWSIQLPIGAEHGVFFTDQ